MIYTDFLITDCIRTHQLQITSGQQKGKGVTMQPIETRKASM